MVFQVSPFFQRRRKEVKQESGEMGVTEVMKKASAHTRFISVHNVTNIKMGSTLPRQGRLRAGKWVNVRKCILLFDHDVAVIFLVCYSSYLNVYGVIIMSYVLNVLPHSSNWQYTHVSVHHYVVMYTPTPLLCASL